MSRFYHEKCLNIIKCHQISPYVIKAHHVSWNTEKCLKKYGAFWWLFMINHDVQKPVERGSYVLKGTTLKKMEFKQWMYNFVVKNHDPHYIIHPVYCCVSRAGVSWFHVVEWVVIWRAIIWEVKCNDFLVNSIILKWGHSFY